MEIITSSQNQYVKHVRALADKKFRDSTGLFVVEGGNIFKDMPSDVCVEYVLATEEREQEVAKLLDYTRARVYYIISDGLMKTLSDTVSPYGIIAVLKKPEISFRLPVGNALLLDGVSDPGNLGTIIRTAAARRFTDIYLLDCADVYAPKVVRSTLGGLFKVNLIAVSLEEAVMLVEKTDSVALDMDGENILQANLSSPVTIIAGSEAHGIRKEIISEAKRVASLPMSNGIESLNVAVATAVAMYQTKGV